VVLEKCEDVVRKLVWPEWPLFVACLDEGSLVIKLRFRISVGVGSNLRECSSESTLHECSSALFRSSALVK
jgi:hypothetical protein